MKKNLLLLFASLFLSAAFFGQSIDCSYIKAGHVVFPPNSTKFPTATLQRLHILALQMKSANHCTVVISSNGNNSYITQQFSWDLTNNIINYLVEKEQIPRERFIFQYGGQGTQNIVEFRVALEGEEGPNLTPPPFPNRRKK